MAAIFNLFSSNQDLLDLISTKLLLRFICVQHTGYKYYFLSYIHFSESSAKYNRVMAAIFNFLLLNLGPGQPDIYKTAFSIHLVLEWPILIERAIYGMLFLLS